MARYQYDECGNLASYFLLTFLSLILVPLTFSLIPASQRKVVHGCQCQPCEDQRARIRSREKRSLLHPQLGPKALLTLLGWVLFAFLAYNVATAKSDCKVYDPFEILGLRTSTSEKDIRSHYKKLSRQYHPDKVKLSGNDTAESVASRFVDFTKAYKALTDETIRENLLKYGNPDGIQETSMGIALPKWIVEAQNNIWVLGVYGLLFGGALPALVGRWWFGSRQKTKDGVNAKTAAAFFKTLKEESELSDVIGALGKASEWETIEPAPQTEELRHLETSIKDILASKWTDVQVLANSDGGVRSGRAKALILLYAHLLRLPIKNVGLQKEQTEILLRAPAFLNALFNISMSRNWLVPTLAIMRLHGYLAQALLPGKPGFELAQLPHVDPSGLSQDEKSMEDFAQELEETGDARIGDVKKALQRWGRLELIDAAFKVIDERIVTPSSIVYLVLKLRISPPTGAAAAHEEDEKSEDVDIVKRRIKANDKKDYEFLTSKKDAEELLPNDEVGGWAHAPFWPANRKPGWWVVLADDKSSKVVVQPMKITDIPFSVPNRERDYRSYKLQFQAPPGVGMYTWKVYLVSDTFIGEEVEKSIVLKVEDVSALTAEEQGAEDEISDPDEDTLAGQMAALRGGQVKKHDEDDEDESDTDGDEESESDSSSDDD